MNQLLLLSIVLFSLLQVSCANLKQKEVETKPIALIETPRVLDDRDSQIISHRGYMVSYNKSIRLPNWVAYELTDVEVNGSCKRNGRFYPDPDVKGKQADNEDYRNSGWDKGHIAPAGDMKWDDQAMLESCYFTNICPQNHNLNSGDWRSLEEKCRDYALRFGNVYIAAGPIIGESKNGCIGSNKVIVPDGFYKVLLACNEGKYEGVGFYFENCAGHRPLTDYAKSIDEIELMTGMDFFFVLPDRIENEVEQSFDVDFWF